MRESQALRRARIITRQSGRRAEADRFRVTPLRGRLVRGVKRSLLSTWGVFDTATGELLEPKAEPDPANGWGGPL